MFSKHYKNIQNYMFNALWNLQNNHHYNLKQGKPETSPRGPASAWVKILKENRFSVWLQLRVHWDVVMNATDAQTLKTVDSCG